MTEGPPRPYVNYIPQSIRDSIGKWVGHDIIDEGIIEHRDSAGRTVYTVKAASTPNARYSTSTLRVISALARKYAGGSMRFTQGLNMEFVTDNADKARALKKELNSIGFPVGGWGKHLWNLTSCAGYFHCALAATDSPSILQRLANDLSQYFNREELPARLGIAVSGCPSACGGSFLPDISVCGIHTEVPTVTDDVKKCDLQGTAYTCPVGAIQLKQLNGGEKSLEIREKLCIGCGLCVGACGGIIFKTPELTDGHAIIIGGRASASRTGTMLGRVVVPFMPNEPPNYPKTVKVIRKIVETWKNDALDGERISDWVERIGWEKFFQKTGLPFYGQSMEYLDIRGITTLRNGSGQ